MLRAVPGGSRQATMLVQNWIKEKTQAEFFRAAPTLLGGYHALYSNYVKMEELVEPFDIMVTVEPWTRCGRL